MEGRSLLSVGATGAFLSNPHAAPASHAGQDQDGSHLQPGDNLPGSPRGPVSGGDDPADQGIASNLGKLTGAGSQPGVANQGNGPAGNPQQLGDPTGNPHAPGDPTGNPHQPGDPTGNPHETGGPVGNLPQPGDPQGDGPQGTGPDPGGQAVGNPQIGGDQGGDNGGGASESIGVGDGHGSVGVGSVGGSAGRSHQNSGGSGRASEDGSANGSGLTAQSGSSHQDASGHAAQSQSDAAPAPETATSPSAIASQPSIAREEAGVPGLVATTAPTADPTGPQAVTAARETVFEVGSVQAGVEPTATPGNLASLIGTLGPALAPSGGSLVAMAPGGLPGPRAIHASLTEPDESPESRPHYAGQGVNLNPSVVLPGARKGGSPGGSAETPAPAEQDVFGRLAESLPIDLTALDRAFEHCLGQIDAMGETLADLMESDGAWPWLMAGVVATTAGTVAFIRSRKNGSDPLALTTGDGTTSSWFLESLSRA